VIELLLCKCKALSSSLSPTRKKGTLKIIQTKNK
jgi:hypothetical protein